MTTESDLIFDNMYQELSPRLDDAIEQAIEGILEDHNVTIEDVEKILYNWFDNSAPVQQFVVKNAEYYINKHKEKQHVSNLNG